VLPKKGDERGVPHTISRGTGNRAYILARLDRERHEPAAGCEGAGGERRHDQG
jgi:hypothetical protein